MEDKFIYTLKASILQIGYDQAREELATCLLKKINFFNSIYEKELTEKSFRAAEAEKSLVTINMGFKKSADDLIEELKSTILALQELLLKKNLEITGYKKIFWNISQSKTKLWEDEQQYR
jgi:hypothetical protein